MKALDHGYNEGRLAFRRYFAECGPNVEQNDPRMPPNPHVGHYGVAWLSGFESERGATSCLPRARMGSATLASGFACGCARQGESPGGAFHATSPASGSRRCSSRRAQ
jgi:hypothetical protein